MPKFAQSFACPGYNLHIEYRLRGNLVRSSKRRLLLIAFINLFALICSPFAQCSQSVPIVAEDGTKVLPLANEQSISTFIPSTAAPGNGLAVNIIYPEKPRYKDGAPIAVVVSGGESADGLTLCVHAAQAGFVEIRFAFPGGGIGTFKSGGYNDYRGARSQRALRDILLFASGNIEDFRHRTIANLVPIPVSTNNIGIVGWSNGGNVALVTMEKYASDLKFLRWLALYECPLGSLFYPPALGSTHDILLNKHYRQGSAATGHCLIDFRQLAWQSDAMQDASIRKKLGQPTIPGIIYFDDNKNGKWDETTEFAFNYCLDKKLNKKIYPPEATSAMERLKIFEPAPIPEAAPLPPPAPKEPAKLQDTAKAALVTVYKRAILHQPAPHPPQKQIMLKPAEKKAEGDKDIAKEPILHPKNWPNTIATLEESENYFQERDGSLSISPVCTLYPKLLVTIVANQVDHLQTQPDHPHIVLQYNAFIDNGAHWVRLNPDSIYLASLCNMNKRNFAQNEPNSALDATAITDYLEPKGILKDYIFVEATIAELADRYRTKDNTSPLTEPICRYSNGATLESPTENPGSEQHK